MYNFYIHLENRITYKVNIDMKGYACAVLNESLYLFCLPNNRAEIALIISHNIGAFRGAQKVYPY